MPDLIPPAAKKKMEAACKTVAKKAGKKIKPEAVGKKAEEAISKAVCKEIKSIDKKAVQFLVDQLKKELDKKKKKAGSSTVPPKPTVNWKPKAPGSGVPSLSIPITEWVIDEKHDTKAKFSIKVWADPKEFKKKDKGVMVNFTVVNW